MKVRLLAAIAIFSTSFRIAARGKWDMTHTYLVTHSPRAAVRSKPDIELLAPMGLWVGRGWQTMAYVPFFQLPTS